MQQRQSKGVARFQENETGRLSIGIISSALIYVLACLAFSWAVMLSLHGCAGTWREQAQAGLIAAVSASKVAYVNASAYYTPLCLGHASQCGIGRSESCVALDQCQDERRRVYGAIKALATAAAEMETSIKLVKP